MPDSLAGLEQQRSGILAQILQLGDFRSGSITAINGRCGKPNCHCHQPGQPGHGPNFRLTRKVNGKTVSESFSSAAELRKAQREVEVKSLVNSLLLGIGTVITTSILGIAIAFLLLRYEFPGLARKVRRR